MNDTEQTNRLGVNLTERRALEAGLAFREQSISDFGIDAQFEVKEDSTPTGRLIAVQIKAGGSYFANTANDGFWYYISGKHKELWINHSLPVIIVLADLNSDVCYYEVVTSKTCLSTSKGGWKILIPKAKVLNAANSRDLVSIASPIVAASDFSICAEQDMSYAGTKRISLDIIAHSRGKSLNRPMLGAIIREALTVGQKSRYSRDEISRKALEGRTADVVFGFVYLREIDRESASWVCRFQWVSPSFTDAFKLKVFQGEQGGNGLVIEWKADDQLPKLLDERRATKTDFLANVDRLFANLSNVEVELAAVVISNGQSETTSELEALSEAFDDLWHKQFSAPLECQRLNQAIQELLATVSNVALIWGRRNSREWKRTRPLLEGYQDDLTRLRGEISFLRQDVR